jgi:hypothetical protein
MGGVRKEIAKVTETQKHGLCKMPHGTSEKKQSQGKIFTEDRERDSCL